MRNVTLLFCALLLLGSCKSKKTGTVAKPELRYEILDPETVDARQKARAAELGKRVLSACNTSRFKAFTSSEATEQLRKNTTPERLTKTCQQYRAKYGTFKGLELVEVIAFKKSDQVLYRYKAKYQKNHTVKEFRVTMEGDKVAAIQSRNWTEKFEP